MRTLNHFIYYLVFVNHLPLFFGAIAINRNSKSFHENDFRPSNGQEINEKENVPSGMTISRLSSLNDWIGLNTNKTMSFLSEAAVNSIRNVPFEYLRKTSFIERSALAATVELDESQPESSSTNIQEGERVLDSLHFHHHPHHETTGIPHHEDNESFQDYYEDWIQFLLDTMKGENWSDLSPAHREIGFCSDNLHLKHQGCSLLIPTCVNYKAADIPDGWTCEMAIWKSCKCSDAYTSFLKYLIPKAKQCYGSTIHSYELAYLSPDSKADLTTTGRSNLIIPIGNCDWSAYFLVYCLVVGSFLIVLGNALVPIIYHTKWCRKRSAVVLKGRTSALLSGVSIAKLESRKLQID